MTASTPPDRAVHRYVIALGSNRRGVHGAPAAEVRAAMAAIGQGQVSPILVTAPLGPSRRRFANAAMLIESDEQPPQLLGRLKGIERAFGRRRGRRWDSRVIDLDIILWSGGAWSSPKVRKGALTIPHSQFRRRDFVLRPLLALVPGWRDPITGHTVRQLAAHLARSGS
ncbi:2-amino-4-hydroxy-6-hydroxymethyldihydropteridine diphosphokinase [Sphingomonas turrisvirgatae]|uniref:2-amino-4-hydroxy-6-hydroxymethyldihydropteridine pyrophosphokinase n=1 Tax=Sphingomonas turrisvirgatae TaxID=1888892 RepID=A0A1E3M0H9_9SPHN|nr:2-amino-4-hydroxy-6-hydroxymethyldihydropteridine diphosphokinase [Sphingomonas turrisvirgatae]ODP39509.1 2-amino-4-hydroxy-6-hydroxymethyldihydropteridine diphosphokinase [Sphingomonas turrisvirgatae]